MALKRFSLYYTSSFQPTGTEAFYNTFKLTCSKRKNSWLEVLILSNYNC